MWDRRPVKLTVEADGYLPSDALINDLPDDPIKVTLIARRLRGIVRDSRGNPVTGALIRSGPGSGVSGPDGSFEILKAAIGTVQVLKTAWQAAEVQWNGEGDAEIEIEPLIIKALHVHGGIPDQQDSWSEFIALTQSTELNGLMIDLKDETGTIFYDSTVSTAVDIGAVAASYDLAAVVAATKEAGLYLIGRIVAFQDPIAARNAPEISVWDTATDDPYTKSGQWFLDPTDPVARDYALDLGLEACRAGVNEVQFDYVRFPDGTPDSVRYDDSASAKTRVATIGEFLNEARALLNPEGCAVAADIFGFIATATDDGGIGQQWEELTKVVDVASPMLYPSHYSSGWFGFDDPRDHPGSVVGEALDDGLERMVGAAVLRPWLQDFGYDEDQVREQIEEASERGLGWMLWNSASEFSTGALAAE